MKISIVVPVMNESGNIHLLLEKLFFVLKQYDCFEIILVDDGSTDDTLAQIKNAKIPKDCENKAYIKCLSFSRNFGHQKALRAGIDAADGDCIISMDGDLQHPPELIPVLIEKWQKTKCNIVYTIREDDPTLSFFKRFTSRAFYSLINSMTSLKMNPGSADFRLIDRKVADVIRNLQETDIFFRGMINWIGFSHVGISYMPEKRHWGKTKYTLKKMLKFAETGITSFSIMPLQMCKIPALLCFMGFIAFTIINFRKVFSSDYGALSVALILLLGTIIFVILDMISRYLGIMFEEQKKRQTYIVKDSIVIK